MKVKNGDILEFVAISWDEPQWEFDFPTVVVSPIVRYSEHDDCETMIFDLVDDLCCGDDLEDDPILGDEFKLKTLKNVCKKRLNGNDNIWKTKLREIVYRKIKFIEDGDYEIIESKNL